MQQPFFNCDQKGINDYLRAVGAICESSVFLGYASRCFQKITNIIS